MNSFLNLRIGFRLGLVFVLLGLLAAGITALTLRQMAKVNDSLQETVNTRWPITVLVNNTSHRLSTALILQRDAMLTGEKEDTDKYLAMVAVNMPAVQSNLDSLVKIVQSERGKELLKGVMDARNAYLNTSKVVRGLQGEGKNEEAKRLLIREARPLLVKYQEALAGLAEHEGQEMAAAGKEAADIYRQSVALVLSIITLAFISAGLLAWWVTRSITTPIQRAVALADAVANGDLTARVTVDSTDETGRLLHALSEMGESLSRTVAKVRDSAEVISSASGEIALGNGDLSARTEQQASSLQQTASSLDQLTTTVKASADAAKQANELAATASSVAEQGGSAVGQVVATMQEISEASKKIADIIGVIDGIAFQTNILALNAAVEAARAGEQGRGFAVVAAEVRNLAQRSALAAKEIKTLISASNEKVGSGSRQVERAGVTMGEIVGQVKRVTSLIAEITNGTLEQSSGINQVNQAVGLLDQATQQNSALVEQSAAAAQRLKEQAQELSEALAAFRIDRFGRRSLASV